MAAPSLNRRVKRWEVRSSRSRRKWRVSLGFYKRINDFPRRRLRLPLCFSVSPKRERRSGLSHSNLPEGNITSISTRPFPPHSCVPRSPRDLSALAPHYSPDRRRLRSSPGNYAEALGNHVGSAAFHDPGATLMHCPWIFQSHERGVTRATRSYLELHFSEARAGEKRADRRTVRCDFYTHSIFIRIIFLSEGTQCPFSNRAVRASYNIFNLYKYMLSHCAEFFCRNSTCSCRMIECQCSRCLRSGSARKFREYRGARVLPRAHCLQRTTCASRHAIRARGTRSDTSCLSSGSGRRQEKEGGSERMGNRKNPAGGEGEGAKSERYRGKSGPLWPDAEIMLTSTIRMESRFPGVDWRVKNGPRDRPDL